MKLNLPRRTKKRLIRPMQSLEVPSVPNQIWALDFMSDSLYQGRRFRTLNILDEGVREGLAIEVDTSLPAHRVVRVLQQLEAWRGLPKAIRLDNGPELTSQYLANWCKDKGIELRFIQPGKPN
jgi:putative transposase